MRHFTIAILFAVSACGGGTEVPPSIDAPPAEDDASSPDAAPICFDGDEDGFGDGCAAGPDCDDGDAGIHPDAAEVCDGVDNDCDGSTDEDLAAPSCELTEGVCAGATASCGGAGGWLPCGAADYGADYESIETICDGLDNDCDGSTDEDCDCLVPGSEQTCGSDVGACATGLQYCLPSYEWGPCIGEVGPMGETCDGVDNDCDGTTDESGDLTPPDCPLQVGVCAGAVRPCDGATGWGACVGTAAYGPDYMAIENDPSCDGLDNDCDGLTDEEGCVCVDGDTQPCGSDVGACQGGLQTCTLNSWGSCVGEIGPTSETCDGTDEDCDGATDDGLIAPPCALQDGVCSGTTQSCGGASGWLACAGTASYGSQYQATESTCDGLDNDCDGSIDEGCACVVGDTQPCGESTGVCEPGTQTCSATGWGTCVGAIGPSPEECDGQDDDCNGVSDDNLTPPSCALTAGVCAGATQVCGGASGWQACTAASYGPSYVATEDGTIEAQCDGLDNDCDGSVDESCISGPIVMGAADSVLPALYQAHLAYLEHDGVSWDVYLIDLRTDAIERLTNTPQDEGRPDVAGNIVVFERGTGAASRIVAYDLATGLEQVLTTAESHDPRISQSLVAWTDRRSGTNDDVYLYDLATDTEYPYLTSPMNESAPDLRGASLIYLTDATGFWRVHVVNLSTGMDVAQGTAAVHQIQARADWSYFGWTDARNAVAPLDTNANWDLFAAAHTTPATEDILSTATGAQILGDVDGRIFVWSDRRNGNWDVSLSAFGGTEFVLTSSTAAQGDPAISGNVLVWEDNRLGSYDIYGSAFGTPAATGAGWLRINEVLADPGAADDVNGDGTANTTQDEFVEILNATDVALDIGGCTLADAVGVRHTFAAGTTIPAASSAIVFGGGTPTGRFGGVRMYVASTGQLGLNNGGDSVTLRCGATTIDTMTFGAEGGMDDALVRSPEYTGAFVRHSTVPAAAGARFSPGVSTSGYGF